MYSLAGNRIIKIISNPACFRARIVAIKQLLEEIPQSEEKNSPRVLLRNGVIPDELKKRFDELQDYEYKLSFALNSSLTFSELTAFNTWFALHPEKVCGKEIVTTSLQFPISVKGTKDDILRVIRFDPTLRLMELEAIALEVELELLKI